MSQNLLCCWNVLPVHHGSYQLPVWYWSLGDVASTGVQGSFNLTLSYFKVLVATWGSSLYHFLLLVSASFATD